MGIVELMQHKSELFYWNDLATQWEHIVLMGYLKAMHGQDCGAFNDRILHELFLVNIALISIVR